MTRSILQIAFVVVILAIAGFATKLLIDSRKPPAKQTQVIDPPLVRVLAAELAGGPARWNEVRIAARVERRPRPGVIPSIEAGRFFVEVMTGDDRGRTIRWPDLP